MARRNKNLKYHLEDYDDYGDYDDEAYGQEQEPQDDDLKRAIEQSKASFAAEQKQQPPKSK